jgi:UDPglucose 6-dehydrogenase
MNVAVVGTGYVGLVTGAVFAEFGNDVTCVDANAEKIENLRQGIMPIYEPGLEEMVKRNFNENRLMFTTDTAEAVKKSEIIFIAVGTPPKENGETDLSFVEAVAKDIAKSLDRYKIIVNKSTVPVGTGDFVRKTIDTNKRRQVDFDVVSNPEFLREGSAINDSLDPDRIVIGAPSQAVAMSLLELYASVERPMLITDVESAEMIKYASNAFLAMKISFINMIANICERAGADVIKVANGMGQDKRIGRAFLNAGLGYGGSCFPKDTLSLIQTAKKFGEDSAILDEVVNLNSARIPRFVQRMEEEAGDLSGKTVGILGLAFKPNTDDMRDAKSLELIDELKKRGVGTVRVYDPVAMEEAKPDLPEDTVYCSNGYECAEGCDFAVIVTEWNEFRTLNLGRLRQGMKGNILFDGRNMYKPDKIMGTGLTYVSVGRKTVKG